MGFFMPLFGQDSIEEVESNGWRKSGAGSAKDHETGFKLRSPQALPLAPTKKRTSLRREIYSLVVDWILRCKPIHCTQRRREMNAFHANFN